jgi:CheY-like chemotaxis protein
MKPEKCSTILLAEDDEGDAFLFETALSKAGVLNPVVRVAHGAEALSYLSGTGDYSDRAKYPFPSLLVTDLKMPRLSGFDLLVQAKPLLELNQLPVVVLSASVAESDKERALRSGAGAFFVKPPDLAGWVALASELHRSWLTPVRQPV